MYTVEEIEAIVAEKVEIFKRAESDRKKPIPEYTEVYKESVEYYERISVHAEIGKFPENIFKNRAPNQSEEEFAYMKQNYKTTTFPIWARYSGVLNRIWNDANWSTKWGTQDVSKEAQKYLEKDYPVYESLEAYFKSVVTSTKEKDSNGILCHKPYKLPIKQDQDGNLRVDDTQDVSPVGIIYNACQVVGYVDSEYALIELCEKSVVQHGNGKQKIGKIYEFYDDTNIWQIKQVGKQIDWKFEVNLYWPHELGYVPFKKLKGIPIQREKEVLYQSRFMSAVEPMDLILLDSSYLQASKAGHAFPHKWEYVDDCEYNNGTSSCIDGKILVDGQDKDCPSCHGTGKKRKASVLGVTQVKAPTMTDDSSKGTIPPFGWGAPDAAILEFLRTEIGFNTEQALSILNLAISNSQVKGGDTALGKQIDREELFSFILGISNEIFDLYDFSHKCIIEMRYGKDSELPVISYPKTFSIRNEADLTAEIASSNENGLPDIAKRKLLLEYLITRFNSQEDTTKIIDLAFATDRLITLTSMEIASKKLSNSIANWEDILHTSIYNFIEELASKDDKFFEKDLATQKKLLIDMAKAKDSEINPSAMDVDGILADVNGPLDTPTDIEAEAKANLKGSVGGVQGLIQIQTSVAQGITSLESAVTMLFEIYGFPEETARKLLGKPKETATAEPGANG